jgi:hypothetical protein
MVQANLASSHVTLRAVRPFASRVLVPSLAVAAAHRGLSVLVRLRLTMSIPGSVLQGRSAIFKIAWH